jgi:hypothetical protein
MEGLMDFLYSTLSGAVGWFIHFLAYSLAPWAWDNKGWLVAAIPLVVLITLAKWIRGG